MNLEDLKKLKEQLESEQKYVAIKNFTYQGISNATEAKPLSEYVSQENTEEFVKQCETLIEKSVRALSEKSIPFDVIMISSEIGFLCKADFIENIKSFAKQKLDNDSYSSTIEQLRTQSSSVYVPLSFNLNVAETGTDDMSIYDYEIEVGTNYEDIDKPRVSGIVNLGVFISKMKSLGYDIELLNYGECQSISDYIQAVKEHGFDTQMNVVANLIKQKRPTRR